MKKEGTVMEYARERSDDLMRAYDEYISACDYIRMPEVYATIVNMPSRRFWVSDIRAALIVSAIMKGEAKLENMWPLKREMYLEIYRRVLELRKEHPTGSVLELCSIAVAQPAPKFYLTPGSAKMMVCRARRQRRRARWERSVPVTGRQNLKCDAE